MYHILVILEYFYVHFNVLTYCIFYIKLIRKLKTVCKVQIIYILYPIFGHIIYSISYKLFSLAPSLGPM